jgi:hypothetical protein
MDACGGLERRLAAAERPGARLRLGRREEADQPEHVEEAAHDLAERRGPFPEGGRLLLRQLGELGLELRVDACGAVDDLEQRLRRQRLELRRQLAVVVRERTLRVEVGEDSFERVRLLPRLRIAGLRLPADALEPPLDVLAVGEEQLELERREVVSGLACPRPAVGDDEERVDPAQVAEELRAGAGRVDDPERGRSHLARAEDSRDLCQPFVRDRSHADVLLARCGRSGVREGVEERRLPRVGEADYPDFQRHAGSCMKEGAHGGTMGSPVSKSVVFPALGRPTMPTSSDIRRP